MLGSRTDPVPRPDKSRPLTFWILFIRIIFIINTGHNIFRSEKKLEKNWNDKFSFHAMKFQVLRKAFAAGAAMFSAILIFCSFQFLQQTKNSIEYIGASKGKVRGLPGTICSRYCAAACSYVCIRYHHQFNPNEC